MIRNDVAAGDEGLFRYRWRGRRHAAGDPIGRAMASRSGRIAAMMFHGPVAEIGFQA
jgi:hypothetical protein